MRGTQKGRIKQAEKGRGRKGRTRKMEKVTVGLESHWPCVTDLSGLSTIRAHGREMSTPPTLSCRVWSIYLYPRGREVKGKT